MRPLSLDEIVGQQHIIGKDKLLYRAIKADRLGSIILYGPPGIGKTTIAKVIANTTNSYFSKLNATNAGIKDVEKIIDDAKFNYGAYKKKTIKAKRKSNRLTTDTIIYEFNNSDDIFDFISLLKNLNISGLNAFTKDFALYTYKDKYYLVMDNINKNFENIKTFLCALTEFGKSINNSNLFKSKLNEYGTLLVKNNFYKALSKNLK